jgi:hypothetical protein
MKRNAVKFNGPQNAIAEESLAIYDYVKGQVEANRKEFGPLEEEIVDIWNGKPKIKQKKGKSKKSKSNASGSNVASIDGVSVDLGDISSRFGGSDSDSDESYGDL